MAIRVLIADDHPVVRQGLRIYLKLDPGIELVGEAVNGQEVIRLARELRPDVVVMDLLMPVMDGIEATKVLRRECPDIEVIALTSVLEDRSVIDAIHAGAIGYILKDSDPEHLLQAIKAAAAGQVQLSPAAAASMVRDVRVPDSPEALTERETEVLRLLAAGCSNKEMAQRLNVSDATVKSHVKSILAKLGLTSRTQAALHAVRIGLVPVRASVRPCE